MAPVGKLVVIVVMGVGLVLAVGQLEDFFGVDEFNQEAVQTTLAEVQRQTGQGGSQFVGETGVPRDVFRDPYLLDFLGLEDTFLERDLETAIVRDMEAFLLEAGNGFAFVERQKRITQAKDCQCVAYKNGA